MDPYDVITHMLLNLRRAILHGQMSYDRHSLWTLGKVCSDIAEDTAGEGTKAQKIAYIAEDLSSTAFHSAMGVPWKSPLLHEEYIVVSLHKEPADYVSMLRIKDFVEDNRPITLDTVLTSMRHDPSIELGYSYQAKALPRLTDVTILDILLEDIQHRDNFVFAHFPEACGVFGSPAFPYIRKALTLPDEVVKHERVYAMMPYVKLQVHDLLAERLPSAPISHLKVLAGRVAGLEERGEDISKLVPILRERQAQLLSGGVRFHLSVEGWAFYAVTTALGERSGEAAWAKYKQMVENRDFLNPKLVWLT